MREKYSECLKALKQRFDPDSKKELYVTELHTRARRRDEDCASYGDALRVLADKAYCDLEEKACERLSITQFLAHIENPQVAFGVRQKRPETVEAAVIVTIELESYLNTASRAQRGSSAVASLSVSAEPSSESLKLLNERLDKLEVLLVSKANTGAHKRRTPPKDHRPLGTAEKGVHCPENCWTHQKQQGQGNSNPSMAWANHEGEAM